jgi:hypothetical protein
LTPEFSEIIWDTLDQIDAPLPEVGEIECGHRSLPVRHRRESEHRGRATARSLATIQSRPLYAVPIDSARPGRWHRIHELNCKSNDRFCARAEPRCLVRNSRLQVSD